MLFALIMQKYINARFIEVNTTYLSEQTLFPENEKNIEMNIINISGNKLSSTVFTSGTDIVNVSEMKSGSYLLLFR